MPPLIEQARLISKQQHISGDRQVQTNNGWDWAWRPLLGFWITSPCLWASRNSDLLTEVVQIFDICGPPDQEQYTSAEGNRFLEACELIKKQNKTYEEVAKHLARRSQFNLQADMQEI